MQRFSKIRDASSDYMTIDTFIQRHPDISEKELNECYIKYRGKEQTYKENTEEYCAFSEKMKLIHYLRLWLYSRSSNHPFILCRRLLNAWDLRVFLP